MTAQVVRSIAFSSPPAFLQTLSNKPSKHQRFANKILYRNVECLYEYLDNWDQTTAQQDVANALAQYGEKIEVVFCNNDAMALGALQSLQQAGRTVGKDVYLVGVDALSEAVQNVVDGNMTGTVLNDDVGQATAAAAATKLYVEGSKVEQYYWVDYVKVTKENAAQYIK